MERPQGLLAASVLMVGGALFARLLSLARDILIAALYGASAETDSFYVAIGLCLVLAPALGGALGMAYVPVHAGVRADGPDREGRFVSAYLQAVCVAAIVSGGLIAALAGPIVAGVAPGLSDAGSARAATELRILALWLGGQTVHLALNGVFESRRIFRLPVAFGIVHMAVIVGLIALSPASGADHPLAWAWGLGMGGTAAAYALLCARKTGYRPVPPGGGGGMGQVLALAAPLSAANLLVSLPPVLDRWFASSLPEGSASSVAFAFLLFNAPIHFLVLPASRAALPFLSEFARKPDGGLLSQALARIVPLACLCVVPLALFSSRESEPLIRLVFERRAFDTAATGMTSAAFSGLAPGMLALALTSVLLTVFAALRDSAGALIALVAGLAVKFGLSWMLIGRMGLFGLTLATSAGYLVTLTFLSLRLRRRIGGNAAGVWWGALLASAAASLLGLGLSEAVRALALPGGVVARGLVFSGAYAAVLLAVPAGRRLWTGLLRTGSGLEAVPPK